MPNSLAFSFDRLVFRRSLFSFLLLLTHTRSSYICRFRYLFVFLEGENNATYPMCSISPSRFRTELARVSLWYWTCTAALCVTLWQPLLTFWRVVALLCRSSVKNEKGIGLIRYRYNMDRYIFILHRSTKLFSRMGK